MSNAEQDVACLHTDIVATLFRVDLKQAVQEMQHRAANRQTRLIETLRTRDEQAIIFGERTAKEVRRDELKVQQAVDVPTNCAVSGGFAVCGDDDTHVCGMCCDSLPNELPGKSADHLLGAWLVALPIVQCLIPAKTCR